MKKTPRVLGRPRQKDKTKPTQEVVLVTATQLFIKKGYKNVSMDDVASACNVTKATIYYYFPTKGDLYASSLIGMMERIRLHIERILHVEKPFKERLEQLVEVHLSATVDIDMKNFMKEATINLSDVQLKKVHASENAMYETIERALLVEMDKGTIRQGNAKFLAHAFMALLTVGYFKDGEGKSLFQTSNDAAKEITDFFWQSIKK